MRDKNPNPSWQEVNKALREVLLRETKRTLRDQLAGEVATKDRRCQQAKRQAQSNNPLNQAQIQRAAERIRDKELPHQERKEAFDTYMINKHLA